MAVNPGVGFALYCQHCLFFLEILDAEDLLLTPGAAGVCSRCKTESTKIFLVFL